MNEWVAPVIAGIFLLAGTVTTVLVNTRASRAVSDNTRAPDVTEAWREADLARAHARRWEDLYYLIRGSFKGFARRMQDQYGDGAALHDSEREALAEETPSDTASKGN